MKDKMTSEEELKKQIKLKKDELAELQKQTAEFKRNKFIKPLDQYMAYEKQLIFDSLYKSALETLKERESGESISDDDEHWAWESVMLLLAREPDTFWKYYNSL